MDRSDNLSKSLSSLDVMTFCLNASWANTIRCCGSSLRISSGSTFIIWADFSLTIAAASPNTSASPSTKNSIQGVKSVSFQSLQPELAPAKHVCGFTEYRNHRASQTLRSRRIPSTGSRKEYVLIKAGGNSNENHPLHGPARGIAPCSRTGADAGAVGRRMESPPS